MTRTPPLLKRILASSLIVLALALLVSNAALYVALHRYLHDNLEAALEQRVAVVADLAAELDPEALAERLTRLGIRTTIQLPDGSAVETVPPVARTKPGVPLFTEDQPTSFLTRRIAHDDGAIITVAVVREGVVLTLRQTLIFQALGSVMTLALAALLLRQTTSTALEPIHSMARTARSITSGSHEHRMNPHRTDTDLGAMAHSFDEMVDRLAAALEDSERSRLRAEQAEERTRQFVADAAHQLRTPITGIVASVDSLLRLAHDDHRRERAMEHLVAESNRCARIVRQLLRLAKLDESEPEDLGVSPISLLRVVRQEIERFDGNHTGVRVGLLCDGDPLVNIRGEELKEMLANLLDNAVRHAESTVAVSVWAMEGARESPSRTTGQASRPSKRRLFSGVSRPQDRITAPGWVFLSRRG